MASKTKYPQAEITQINVGVEQLLDVLYCQEHEAFYIAVPQLARRFQFDRNQATRTLKRLLGEGFQFDHKFRTPLNPKAINAIQLSQYEKVVTELAFNRNDLAKTEVRAMAGLSYVQLASDSFGIVFDASDRAAWMKRRREGKLSRLTTTDAVKLELKRTGKDDSPNAKWSYKNWSDRTYKHLFGATAKQLREHCNLPNTATPRDYLSEKALLLLQNFEEHLGRDVERLGLTLKESYHRTVQCYDPMPAHLIFK